MWMTFDFSHDTWAIVETNWNEQGQCGTKGQIVSRIQTLPSLPKNKREIHDKYIYSVFEMGLHCES